jgi:integrase
LTWPDVDVRTRKLTIRHQLLRATGKGLYLQDAAKTNAGDREILLPKSLATMLRDHRKEQLELMAEMGDEWVGWEFDGQPVALVFAQANGRPIGAHTDTKDWHALLTAAGLTEVRRYKARHTAASHLVVDSGGDVAVTAKILGHADSGFTYRTYVKPLAAREQALADKMDEPRAPYRAPYDAAAQPDAAEQSDLEPSK